MRDLHGIADGIETRQSISHEGRSRALVCGEDRSKNRLGIRGE